MDSRFAYEADKNPDFATYIRSQESDYDAFMRHGFESSRRGMNLNRRLESNCPRQIRKSEKDGTTDFTDRGNVYQSLGEQQGYWDDQGNTLKPLEAVPAPAEPAERLSKKERVEQLTNQVAALPTGAPTTDKLNDLMQGVQDLVPQASGLQDKLDGLTDKLADVLPKPDGLLGKVTDLLGSKSPLKDFISKIPGSDVLDTITGFFSKGDRLKKKAEKLKEKARRVQDQLDKVKDKAAQTGQDLGDKAKEIADLEDKLDQLKSQQQDLQTLLDDKPRRILDELTEKVRDAEQKGRDLLDQIAQGAGAKDKLKKELDKLLEEKEALEDKIEEIEKDVKDIADEAADLTREGDELSDKAKKETKQGELIDQVNALPDAEDYKKEADACKEELLALLPQLGKLDKVKKKSKFSLGKLLAFPGKLAGKVTGLLSKSKLLKGVLSAIPGVGNIINTVDNLIGKGTALGSLIETLTGKQSGLLKTLEGIASKVDLVKGKYDDKVAALEKIQQKISKLGKDKTDLLTILSKPLGDLSPIEAKVLDFVKENELLGKDSKCTDPAEIKEEADAIEEEYEEVEPAVEEIEEEWEAAEAEVEELETETEAVAEEVEQIEEQQAEVEQEEEAIREQFGQDVELEPVSVEEYAESFEIERPYWEATFHPDDEVVEGYKGRYFQVQLRDADKSIKLLFRPGEYRMGKGDFRDNYGSVIGAFVTEALVAIRKSDREGVKLFVQGSADISGASSFRGNLEESFYYDELEMLPKKGSENFAGESVAKNVPERGFTNDDLPNLRCNSQYLI